VSADGAYFEANDNCLSRALNDVINYVRLIGKEPGSDKWIGRWFGEMRELVNRRVKELCSVPLHDFDPPVWDELLRERWCLCRKKGYKILKRGGLLTSDHRPLFVKETPGGVVYVYSGRIATQHGRLIKIGYTGQVLKEYLDSKRLQHDPILLATMPGDQATERHFHYQWQRILIDGREWFEPCVELRQWIKRTFHDLDPAFEDTFARAIELRKPLA